MTDLFDPFDLHGLALPNRALMSAMTRTRATEDGVPTDLMVDYYVQRAEAGLIVTECMQVSEQGHGIIRCPGIHRDNQIEGWKRVTDAVHAAGGRIYAQIWHCGRVDFPVPRELAIEEIAPIVESFAQATRNARNAGFDGVELHGANGYLQNQFLEEVSNQRTDAYGGSIENRARLMIETTKAMIDAWSADRVGVRLSPSSALYGMATKGVLETYSYVVRALDALGVGFLCLLEPNAKELEGGVEIEHVAETFRPMTSVPVIVNTGFDKAKANAAIANGHADLVSFGVPFLANPDLVERLRVDAPLNKPDPSKFYGEGPEGYTDYPTMEAVEA